MSLRLLLSAWAYGLVCGLGAAVTIVGLLRGEAAPGVLWPALIPILVAPLLILRVMRAHPKASSGSTQL